MVIDTSAICTLLCGEPGAGRYELAIGQDPHLLMSVASILEVSIVLENRYGPEILRELDFVIARLAIEIVPVDLDQLEWARYAYRTYGKGRHPAGLNFGDCFSYALAKSRSEKLLFRGNDFSRTDIPSALAEN